MEDEKGLSSPGLAREPIIVPLDDEKKSKRSPSDLDRKEPISIEDGGAPPKSVLEHSYDADEAMKAFAEGEVEILDETTNRRLLRKIDLNIMPVG